MIYHTIVTHENPDLDAILSSLLLKLFGEEKFPGITKAKMAYVSAGAFYNGEKSHDLLKKGIITVDTGGGRFDTHPDENNKVDKSKLDRSATDLVAEYLGILQHPEWKHLIEYTRIHDSTGVSLISSVQIHHLTSIQSILNGLKILFPNDNDKMIELGSNLLTSMANYYAKDHLNALPEMTLILTAKVEKYIISRIDISEVAKEKILEWVLRMKQGKKNSFPKEELDIAVNLRTLFVGATSIDKTQGDEMLKLSLKAILAREDLWFEAIVDIKENAIIRKIGNVKLCYIKSSNPLVIKASRYLEKADLTIFQDKKSSSITFLIRNHGKIRKGIFRELVQTIRIAESVELNISYDRNKLKEMGTGYNWFYHQSGNFIINGSAKAKVFEPTLIKIDDLLQLTYCEVVSFISSKEQFEYPAKYRNAINIFKLSNLIG